jgi:N-glycosylase/DNA lyase
MWNKLLTTKGSIVTSSQLHLKNTLMNGQCFNWKCNPQENNSITQTTPEVIYIGCVNKNIIALKADSLNSPNEIFYKFLFKNTLNKDTDAKFFQDYFQLEVDIGSMYNSVKKNLPKDLQTVMETYTGVRIIRQDPFECILSFICSSNNNIDRIRKMLESFKEKYGELLYEDEVYGKFYSFPNLIDLGKLKIPVKENDLRDMGFGYRAKYIVESLKYMREKNSEGEDWFEILEKCLNPVEQLLNLTGVGRKVADCIQLFSLKKHNVVPLDIHMVKFFNESVAGIHKFKKIENLNKKTYEEVSENYIKVFGEYAGWLHSIFYMNRIDKEGKSTEKKGKKRKAEDEVFDDRKGSDFIDTEVNLKKKKVNKKK